MSELSVMQVGIGGDGLNGIGGKGGDGLNRRPKFSGCNFFA